MKNIVIKTALISVTDKTGLLEFAQALVKMIPHLHILASGGTAAALQNGSIPVTSISKYTQYPECFEGRVKTLHPAIAGGILLRRGIDETEAKQLGIEPIDLVICNLYDFASAAKEQSTERLMEYMDIGGSTLIRSSVKNFAGVAIAVDPDDYPRIIQELKEHHGSLTYAMRKELAAKAILYSADYEAQLAQELSGRLTGQEAHHPRLSHGKQLRYGENPDQKAWIYHSPGEDGIAQAKVVAGKEMSYNNFEDATVAYNAAQELLHFGMPFAAAIIKHGNLCSYATGPNLPEAFRHAWDGDPKSAFGSVIALTSLVTDEMIPEIKDGYIEVLIAPEFSDTFLAWAKRVKPNLRLIQSPLTHQGRISLKTISGGVLVQTRKDPLSKTDVERFFVSAASDTTPKIGLATKTAPPEANIGLAAFAIAAVQYAKSNAVAIVYEWSKGYYQVLSIGSGQPNRVDSLERLALPKAIENIKRLGLKDSIFQDCILASDGFFPFDDSVRTAAKYGIKMIIQPGGSVRDEEVIHAANELGISMIFTGKRYFYH